MLNCTSLLCLTARAVNAYQAPYHPIHFLAAQFSNCRLVIPATEEAREEQRKNILSQSVFHSVSLTSFQSVTPSRQISKVAQAVSQKRIEALASQTKTKEDLGIAAIVAKQEKPCATAAKTTTLVSYDGSDSD